MIIDFYILVYQLMLLVLRDEYWLRFFWCAIEPIQVNHDEWQVFSAEYTDKATVNSQIMVLEDYLNRFFGVDSIVIYDGDDIDFTHIYHTTENQTNIIVYHADEEELNPILYHEQEQNTFDLIIRCPAILATKENQIRAILREYLFADKLPKIEFI